MTHLAYAMAAGAVLGVISGAVLAGAAMRMRFRGILQVSASNAHTTAPMTRMPATTRSFTSMR